MVVYPSAQEANIALEVQVPLSKIGRIPTKLNLTERTRYIKRPLEHKLWRNLLEQFRDGRSTYRIKHAIPVCVCIRNIRQTQRSWMKLSY